MTLDEYRNAIGDTDFFTRERREGERRSGVGRRTYDGYLNLPQRSLHGERRQGDRRISVYVVHNDKPTERIK